MGLPGNLDMAEEMTSKYFGIEGRTKFHNRVSWVANQREKCCLDPEEFQHTLVYEEPFHGKALHNQIPFGATRQTAAAELRGDLQEPSSGSHGGGGKFFDRFKDPALQAQAGIGFNSRSGRLDGYVNNEDAMLRTSRMRSGDDPRDEEEEDANFPLRAQARQADMDEDYMQMLRSEAKKQNSGSLIRNERVVVSPIKVNCQTSASTGKMGIEESKVDVAPRLINSEPDSAQVLSTQAYDRLNDGSLIMGGDFSLVSIDQSQEINSDILADRGYDDHDYTGNFDQDEIELKPEFCSEKEDLEYEKMLIRDLVRNGPENKNGSTSAPRGKTWKQSYMRRHGHLLDLSAPVPAAINRNSDCTEDKSTSISENSWCGTASARNTTEEEQISRKYAKKLKMCQFRKAN